VPPRRNHLDQPLQKIEQAIEERLARTFRARSRRRAAVRFVGWGVLVVYFLFALAVLFARYYALPRVGEYKDDLERHASRVLGQRITVGAIEAGWQGLRPELLLADVTVYDRDGRAALRLPAVEATVSDLGADRIAAVLFCFRSAPARDPAHRRVHGRIGCARDGGNRPMGAAQRDRSAMGAPPDDGARGALLALPVLNFTAVLPSAPLALRARPPAERPRRLMCAAS
jgi:hypothetical protein